MKKRVFKGMACAGILFLIDRISTFQGLYSVYRRGFMGDAEFTENLIIGDYNSVLNMLVCNMIIFVMLEGYMSEGSPVCGMVRYADMERWQLHRISRAFLHAAVFSLLHEGIGTAFVAAFGNVGAAARHGYFAGVLMQVFSTTFYLVTVYIVKEFFRTFFAASLSQLFTIAAFSALYYVMQYFIFPGQNAFAGSDLLEQYCMGAFGAGGCVSALVKKACLIMVSGALLVGARKRGDILA